MADLRNIHPPEDMRAAGFVAHIHGPPITMFRLFTVCAPWGRSDRALFRFTKAIPASAPIDICNQRLLESHVILD